MTLETPILTPVKRKRGGQPGNTNALNHGAPRGNSNALVHGFRSALNPSPYEVPLRSARVALGLVSPQRSESKTIDSKQLVLNDLRLIKQIDQTLALFAPRMLLADTGEEMMQWFRPIQKLIRVKQKLMKSMLVGSYHDRVLFTLSRDPMQWVNREFKDRDLREFPILPPPDYDSYCADSSANTYRFLNSTIIPPSTPDLFVWIYFKKSTQITRTVKKYPVPSPFLTNQQWLLISDSLSHLLGEIKSSRKYERNKLGFPLRLLVEAMLIKLAFNLSWKVLPGLFKIVHPNLASLPWRKCQSLYRDLYNSGFLIGMYKQIHLHLSVYGGTSLEKLVKKGYFQIDNKSIFLAPGKVLSWQNFTALLLLQRGYHNYRVRQRESMSSKR